MIPLPTLPEAKNRFRSKSRSEHGVALILTLAILVLVTMLVVAFAVSMRVEHVAARNYSDQVRARHLAMAAVDEAVARLRMATPVINATTNYVTMPGRIFIRAGSTYTNIPLYSTGTTNTFFDLNLGNQRIINRVAGRRMAVEWRNWVMPNNPKAGYNNLYGRYCYWIDDEASKININVARRRPASPLDPTYTPQDLDLRALGTTVFNDEAVANASYTYGQTVGYLSPNSWPAASPSIPALFVHSNFFRITTFNSPDVSLTPWGTPRFNLNTNLMYSNPGAYLTAITNVLANARLRDWFPGTFREKYGDKLLQIAANIKDYIDTDDIPTDSHPGTTTQPTYLGLEKTPYLNELVISNRITVTVNTNWMIVTRQTTTLIELWYMYPPPAADYDLSGHTITIENRPSITFNQPGFDAQILPGPMTFNLSGTMTPAPWSGSYLVLQHPEPEVVASGTVVFVDMKLNPGTVRMIFRRPDGVRIDYALVPMTNYVARIFRTMASLPATNFCWVTACADPRVRPVSDYWNPVGGGTTPQNTVWPRGTLGGFNTGTVYYDRTNTPPLTTARILSDGAYIGRTPEYSCHTNISNRGTLASVGELGFIHTGVPWRTFALRPQHTFEKTQNLIPDWAVLDLFCTTNRMVGRINLNSRIYISNEYHAVMSRQREIPIRSLYYSGFQATIDGASARIASNIQWCIWNTEHAYLPPTTWAPFDQCYGWIGQVCEVDRVTSNNVAKEVSERGIRSIANLITTRSNVFTIWAVGQAIVDANNDGEFDWADGDIIAGEVVVQAVVERYEDTTKAVTDPNRIKFRTRYINFYTN